MSSKNHLFIEIINEYPKKYKLIDIKNFYEKNNMHISNDLLYDCFVNSFINNFYKFLP